MPITYQTCTTFSTYEDSNLVGLIGSDVKEWIDKVEIDQEGRRLVICTRETHTGNTYHIRT